jgi:tetratricopeptide (TPR) repeat protein
MSGMNTSGSGSAPATGVRRRWWLMAAGLTVLLAAGGYGWYRWTTPVPPVIDLTGAEPAVVEAVAKAHAAVRRSPRSGPAWGELGMVLFANGFPEQADLCLSQAEALDPETPSWPYLRAVQPLRTDRAASIVLLRRALDRARPDDPRWQTISLVLAEALTEVGRLEEAASLCRSVLERQPENPRAQFDLGLIALGRDDPRKSMELLSIAAASPFAARRARVHLATAAQRFGDDASAAAFLRRAEQLPQDPDWPDMEMKKAMAYQVGMDRRLRDIEQQTLRGNSGRMAGPLRELAEESGDGVPQYYLGALLVAEGDFAAAEPALRIALQKSPELSRAKIALGLVLLRSTEQSADQGRGAAGQARFREAADLFRAVIAKRPGQGLAYLYLGLCLQHLGQEPEALAALRMGVQCQPHLAEAQLALGEALAHAGEREQGLQHLKHAQDLAPQDTRMHAALARWSAPPNQSSKHPK